MPQGGLKISCKYIFEGPPVYVDKVKHFITAAPDTAPNSKVKNDCKNNSAIIVGVPKTNSADNQSTDSKAAANFAIVLPVEKDRCRNTQNNIQYFSDWKKAKDSVC